LKPRKGSRVVSHGAIYVAGNVIQRGLSLLLLPVLLEVMSLEEYGLVGTSVALAALLSLVYNLGINAAIVRSYYDDNRREPTAGWSALLGAQIVVAAIMAALTFLAGPYWSSVFRDVAWGPALQMAVLFAYVSALQMTAQGVVQAARRPVLFVLASLLQLAVGSGLGIWLAARHGASGYLVGMTIGAAAATLVCLVVTYRPPRWRLSIIRAGFRLGFPFMFHALSGWGMSFADRLLVAVYLGIAAVGRYQVAYVLASALMLVMASLQGAWTPHYIGELDEGARRRVPPALVLPVTALVGAATGLLVLSAPYIVAVIAPQVHGVELVIALIASASLVRAPYFVAVVVLLDVMKSGRLATASLMGAVLNIVVNVTLIPTLGLPAAAAATVAAVALQAVIVLIRAQDILQTSLQLPQLTVAWIAGLAALVAIAELPYTTVTAAIRGVIALGLVAGGWHSAQWLQRRYRSAVARPG
jgi:O-antigen/teichoic acid export membrane protein